MPRLLPLAFFAGIGLACASPTSNDGGGGGGPALTFQVSPASIVSGGTSQLSWSSPTADNCTASGGWSGSKGTAGNENVSPSATTSYTLACAASGGTTTLSRTVTVTPAPPSVALTATPSSIAPGDSSHLVWSSTGAASCSASGAWTGPKNTNDALYVKPANTVTYTLACTGAGGTATQSVIVTVSANPVVTVSLSASPSSISSGQSSTLTWSSTGATTCTASDGWNGSKPLSGTAPVSPTLTTTYTLTCSDGSGGSAAQSVTVTVGPGLPPGSYVYPLKVGPTAHYLVDQNDKPFFLAGEAAWSLIAQLSNADVDTYLDSRQQLGFTMVLVNLIEHKFSTNAPANLAGDNPFSGTAFQSTPNEAYFAHADYVIQAAAQRGIVVLLAPIYLGSSCDTRPLAEGWCGEIGSASVANMKAWGAYVGNRYKSSPNIVWLIGGDANPDPVKSKVQAVIDGIDSVDTGHIMTVHNNFGFTAVDYWGRPGWLAINDVYTYETGSTRIWQDVLAAYHVTPAIPVFLIESKYENETDWGVTQQQLRSQTYWTVLSGGFGNIFGNCPIWNFDAPDRGAYCPQPGWQGQLNSQGSRNMRYAQKLFTARHWHLLVPDEGHTVLTAGFGSGATYATAAKASDGSSIIAYLPNQRQVTVNAGTLSGTTISAYWYNPATGVATSMGTGLPKATPLVITPPTAGDWVLVVDSDTFGFPSP